MKKIIINGRFLGEQTTGLQRTAQEIVNSLDNINSKFNIELVVPNSVKNIPKYKQIKVVKFGKFEGKLWEQIDLFRYIKRENGIGLNLCNTAPLLSPGMVMIHDIRFIHEKDDMKTLKEKIKRNWQIIQGWFLCKFSKRILTVSNFSKNEIAEYYNVSNDDIRVIYNGWQHFNRIKSDFNILKKFDFLEENKYYFAMSSIAKHKNFKWILNIAKYNPKSKFVIAGATNPKYFSESLDLKEVNNVYYIGYIADEEAKALMEKCKAFLFPSLYEGFGIPPLEALSIGTKTIVSDIQVLREIYKDSVYYINPYEYNINLDNILLENILYNDDILEKYTWENTAIEILNEISRLYK